MKVIKRKYDEFGRRLSVCQDSLGKKITIYTENSYDNIVITYDGVNNYSISIGNTKGIRVFMTEIWKVKTGLLWSPMNLEKKILN